MNEYIYLDSLKKKYNFVGHSYVFNTIVGEYDAPKKQEQGLFSFDLTDKNTLIYGMQGSGKENFITTLLYSLMIHHHPKEVNVYIADFGSETLTVFNGMPHVGDVFISSDSDKLEALIKKLNKEFERRKKLFVDFSGSYVEYNHNNEEKEPLILVVINAFEVFQETYSRSSDLFDVLFRDGAKYGITFVVSTSVTGAIRGRNAQNFSNKISMRLADDSSYRDLVGSDRGLVPSNKFGRGLATIGEETLEVQSAYICEKEKINSTIRNTSKYLFDAYKYKAPKLQILPDIVNVDDVLFEMQGINTIPIGIEINSLEVYVYDFTLNKTNLILSNDIEKHMGFVNALVKEFLLNANVDVKVIDINNFYNSNYEKEKIYKDNFDNLVLDIKSEIENDKSLTNMNIVIGLGNLKNKLSVDNYEMFTKLLESSLNLEKNIFVFIDDYSSIKNVQIEPWYRNSIDDNYGIWLGEGVGDQIVINVSTLSFDDKKIMFPYISYPIYKGNHMIVKYVTEEKEEKNEE